MDRSYVPNLITWGEMVDMIPLSRGGRAVNRVPQQSLVDTYLMLSGKTISEAGTDYNPAYPYDNRDPRLTATIIYDGYDWSGNVDDGSKDVVINIRPVREPMPTMVVETALLPVISPVSIIIRRLPVTRIPV